MMQHKQTSSNLEVSDDESEATDSEKNTEYPNFNKSNEIENEDITSLIDSQKISNEPVSKK